MYSVVRWLSSASTASSASWADLYVLTWNWKYCNTLLSIANICWGIFAINYCCLCCVVSHFDVFRRASELFISHSIQCVFLVVLAILCLLLFYRYVLLVLYGEGTVVSIVSCGCAYCCPEPEYNVTSFIIFCRDNLLRVKLWTVIQCPGHDGKLQPHRVNILPYSVWDLAFWW